MKFYYFLGLGTNISPRMAHLNSAVAALENLNNICKINICKISPVYKSRALLLEESPEDWDQFFLNCVVKIETDLTPEKLLSAIKEIEVSNGRNLSAPAWSPRPIDIDILMWSGTMPFHSQFENRSLIIPHPRMGDRAFVLDPLKDLQPELLIETPLKSKQVLSLARENSQHSPAFMEISNITPDSFSDGGRLQDPKVRESYFRELFDDSENCIAYVDIGAESTRPGAQGLQWELEWARLEPVFAELKKQELLTRRVRPRVSLDTRHGQVAQRAAEYGIDLVNDVSGGRCPYMREFYRESHRHKVFRDYVLMHSLSVPADPQTCLSDEINVIEEIGHWFEKNISVLINDWGLSREQIILDPGIGFGKTMNQSWRIIRNISAFQCFNCRILVGASRKSFLKRVDGSKNNSLNSNILKAHNKYLDAESMGLSLALCSKGVDILRVHEARQHQQAWLAKMAAD